mgnify:CR=1 FL=1
MTSEANPGGLPPGPSRGPGPVRRFILPGLFVIALLVALFMRRPDPQDQVTLWKLEGEIFGTTFVVKIVPGDTKVDQETLTKLIEGDLASVDATMSTYKSDSELSRFNASADTKPQSISEDLAEVLDEALRLHKLTRGAFDVTVGPIVNLWGFGPDKSLDDPSPEALAEAKKRVGSDKLTLDLEQRTLQKSEATLYVDLSAIAKGYAVDRIGKILEDAGLSSYMVEIGGEVRSRGTNVKGIPWQLGIEKPQEELTQTVALIVGLDNLSMATSGNYRNFSVRKDGRKVSHAIDARTGEPVDHSVSSVTVLHKNCMTADALATGLYALGRNEGLKVAEEHKLAVIYVEADGDSYKTFASSTFPEFQRK